MEELEKNGGNDWFSLLRDTGRDMLGLVKAELLLSLAEMPRLLALWLMLVPLALLAWLGLSLLAAWGAWYYTLELGWALLAFFVLQLLACLLVWRAIANAQKQLFLPMTRKQIHQARGMEADE